MRRPENAGSKARLKKIREYMAWLKYPVRAGRLKFKSIHQGLPTKLRREHLKREGPYLAFFSILLCITCINPAWYVDRMPFE